MIEKLNPKQRVVVLIGADVLFILLQAPMFIAAYKSEIIANLLFCGVFLLAGLILFMIFKMREHLWLRVLSGVIVIPYLIIFGYYTIRVFTHVDP